MTEQPMPTAGLVEVAPVARSLFLATLLRQEIKGRETYGTGLRTENGRDPFRDALEELVDAWQYVVQALLEAEAKDAEIAALKARVAELETHTCAT